MSNVAELREMDTQALRGKIVDCRREMLQLRMQGQSEGVKTHRFRVCRRMIARIKTIINEKGGV